MATKQKATLEMIVFSWGSAAGLAALIFVLLTVLGGWGVIQAVWMAAMAFVLVGAFNYFIFARPTPPLAGTFPPSMASASGRAAPASTRKGPSAAPAATDSAASEPTVTEATMPEDKTTRAQAAPVASAGKTAGDSTQT